MTLTNPVNAQLERPPLTAPTSAIDRVRDVIDVEIAGLHAVQRQLSADVDIALDLMHACTGRVVITGMGKSGLIGKKIAATLSSTGTPSIFLHPAEGSHGDLGTLTRDDVVIAISNSGETPEILAVLPLIKRFGLPLIAMTGKSDSTLALQASAVLNVSVPQEACSLGLAPTASTTATVALGDALAVVLLERKGFTSSDFAMFHPAGSLGKRLLLRVEDIMHTGNDIPKVATNANFIDVLTEINAKTLGLTLVTSPDTHQLLGVITDGDIRRALAEEPNVQHLSVERIMGRSPKTILPHALAVEALNLMQEHKITALVITNEDAQPVGVLHMHDLIRAGIA